MRRQSVTSINVQQKTSAFVRTGENACALSNEMSYLPYYSAKTHRALNVDLADTDQYIYTLIEFWRALFLLLYSRF